MRVGFIGLGNQGAPMARRIAEDGFPLTLWARRPVALEPFADLSVDVAATPKELGERCDIIGVCVIDSTDVDDVVLGPAGVLAGMRPGGTVLIHSTVDPGACRRLGEMAATTGVEILDAPVSGGGQAAIDGTLLVMVGGSAAGFERCLPVLSTFGNPVRHLGPLGSGQVTKLINNALVTANLSLVHDAVSLAESLGIETQALIDTLQHGSGSSFAMGMYERIRPPLDLSTSASPGRAGTLLRKDIDLISRLAAERQLDLGYLKVVADRILALLGSPGSPPD